MATFTSIVIGVVISMALGTVAVPRSPCPKVFYYTRNARGEVFGVAKFRNDLSGDYKLLVYLSVDSQGRQVDARINLYTATAKVARGGQLEYHILFPTLQDPLPVLTGIEFNDISYCSGPNARGYHVVNLWRSKTNRIPMNVDALYNSENEEEIYSNRRPYNDINSNTFNSYEDTSLNHYSSEWIPDPDYDYVSPRFGVPASKTTSRDISTKKVPTKITTPLPTKTTTSLPDIITRQEVKTNETCGILDTVADRILFGADASILEHPWLVAILYNTAPLKYDFLCGATLISEKHVLTAAHCLTTPQVTSDSIDRLLLALGNEDLEKFVTSSEQLMGIERYEIHPEYKRNGPPRADADLALLIMSNSARFGPKVKPICLWNGADRLKDIVGEQGSVSGWGTDERGRPWVPTAKQITLPIVSGEVCLRSNPSFNTLTSNRTFCAGKKIGLPCKGDSGSGFVMQKDGRWMLRGVVSLGVRGEKFQCDVNKYSVFVDVPMYKDWLMKLLS